jgi:hypothetical protein
MWIEDLLAIEDLIGDLLTSEDWIDDWGLDCSPDADAARQHRKSSITTKSPIKSPILNKSPIPNQPS